MTLLRFLLLPALAAAHFTLDTPTPVGPFNEDTEGTAPCGGVSIDVSKDNATDFHVGGEAIALFLGHPQGNWLFRATLDQTASSNWSQIYPIFTQTGQGDYCQPAVAAPSSFAGQKGILGIAMDGPDGILYQVSPKYLSFLTSMTFLLHILIDFYSSVLLSTLSREAATTPPPSARIPAASLQLLPQTQA